MRKEKFSAKELEEMISQYSYEVKKLSFQLENAQRALEDLQKEAKGTPAPAPVKTQPEEKVVKVEVKAKEKPKAKEKANGQVKAKGKAKAQVKAETETAPKRRGRPRKEKVETKTTESAPVAETTEAPKKKRGRPKKDATATAAAKPSKKKASKERTLKDEESTPKGYRLSDWDLFIINTIKKSGRVMVNFELMEKALARVKREKMDLDEMALRGKLNRSIHKLTNRRGDLVKVEDYPGKGFAYGLPEWRDENGNVRAEYIVSLN